MRELRRISFTIENVVPPTTTHHDKRIVRAGKFTKLGDSEALQKARDFWTQHLAPRRPSRPLEGPLELAVKVAWPYLSGEPKRNRTQGGLWHTSKPDCSNVVKTLEDRLREEGFIRDDAEVACLMVRKVWADLGSVEIRITELASPRRRD